MFGFLNSATTENATATRIAPTSQRLSLNDAPARSLVGSRYRKRSVGQERQGMKRRKSGRSALIDYEGVGTQSPQVERRLNFHLGNIFSTISFSPLLDILRPLSRIVLCLMYTAYSKILHTTQIQSRTIDHTLKVPNTFPFTITHWLFLNAAFIPLSTG